MIANLVVIFLFGALIGGMLFSVSNNRRRK